jgi:hypothetical protein
VPPEAKELLDRHQEIPYQVMTGILAEGLFWSIIRGLALYRATRRRVFARGGAALLKSVFPTD